MFEIALHSRRCLLLIGALLAGGGCGDDPEKPEPVGIEGSYTLRTAGGATLPATIHEETVPGPPPFHVRIDANSGLLTLEDDGYVHQVFLSIYIDGQMQPGGWNDHGSFTVTGDSISFVSELYETIDFTGTVDGATITALANVIGEEAAGIALVYSK